MARRRSQDDRNRAAQERFRRLGMDPGPRKGAEYRWQVHRGQQQGLSRAQSYGKPRAGEASKSTLRAQGQLPSLRPQRKEPQNTTLPGGAGDIWQTTSARTTARVLRSAARTGQKVSVRLHGHDPAQGYRLRIIDGRDAGPLEHIANTLRSAGARRGTVPTANPQVQLVAKPHIFVTDRPEMIHGPGLDPGDLLAYLLAYRDFMGAWKDLFASVPLSPRN